MNEGPEATGGRPSGRRRRLGRSVFILPSLFTVGNLFCGYYAIIATMRGHYDHAAQAIGIAIILDMLDGRIARMTNSATGFGLAARLAGRRHIVRHRPIDPGLCLGAGGGHAARRLGRRLHIHDLRGDAAGALQYPGRAPEALRRAAYPRRRRHGRRRGALRRRPTGGGRYRRRLAGRRRSLPAVVPDGQHDQIQQPEVPDARKEVPPHYPGARARCSP